MRRLNSFFLFSSFFLFFNFNLFSQLDSPPNNGKFAFSGSEKIDSTKVDSIKKTEPIIPKMEILTDADEQYLRSIDSLWTLRFREFHVFEPQKTNFLNRIKTISEEELKKRLTILNSKSPIDIEYNPVVHAYIDRYLNSGDWFSKTMGLAEYYFPLFEEILDRYNMPLEIKYLAVVESALKPRAISRAGARGLWQFMYTTGKLYHLESNSYIDERDDPYLATEAACRFLTDLHNMFDDWNLALAAYNSGPGNVLKAIRRSGGKRNYWNLRPYLPLETRGYIPAFIAVNYVMEYAGEHHLPITAPITTIYDTDTIRIKQKVTFDQFSQFLQIPIDIIEFLNPLYKRNVVPGIEGERYFIRLPRKKIGLLSNNENGFYAAVTEDFESKKEKSNITLLASNTRTRNKSARAKLIYHKIRKGETLGHIAKRYGVSVSNLKKWNRLRSNTIGIGKSLKVYSNKKRATYSKRKYHKVRKGEGLIKIAKKYRTTVSKIKKLNKLKSSNIRIGKLLKIR